MSIIGAAFSLFLVYNVLGNIPFYIAILKPFSPKRQKMILIREMLIALGVLFLFGSCGDDVLAFLGIHQAVIGVGGGLLLLLISLTMIFPKHSAEGLPDHEPMIVPIAVPGMAGPGSIATIMLFARQFESFGKVALIIFLAWLPSLAILLIASNIKRFFGEKGLIAIERFGGLLMTLIAVQMMAYGIINLVRDNFNLPPPPAKASQQNIHATLKSSTTPYILQ